MRALVIILPSAVAVICIAATGIYGTVAVVLTVHAMHVIDVKNLSWIGPSFTLNTWGWAMSAWLMTGLFAMIGFANIRAMLRR